jgi:casein kinase 1 gamma
MLGIPKVYLYTEMSGRRMLVMELLGCNLEELFNLCGRHFLVGSVCKLAVQMLDRLKHVHSKGLVYRDLKPENFVMGKYGSARQNIVHLVDFGLAKPYVDADGQHIPAANNRSLTGTARYMSLNAHAGMEQSRRDDLISLGFVIVYLMRGRLPWQGLPADDAKEKCRKIAEVKRSTSVEELCNELPVELLKYFYYVYQLDFYDAPDYAFVRSLFGRVLAKLNVYEYDMEFEWNAILAARYQHKRRAKLQAAGELKVSMNAASVLPEDPNLAVKRQVPINATMPDKDKNNRQEVVCLTNVPVNNAVLTESPEEWEEKAALEGQFLSLPAHELVAPNHDPSKPNFSTENIHNDHMN